MSSSKDDSIARARYYGEYRTVRLVARVGNECRFCAVEPRNLTLQRFDAYRYCRPRHESYALTLKLGQLLISLRNSFRSIPDAPKERKSFEEKVS